MRILVILFTAGTALFFRAEGSHAAAGPRHLVILWYNVENLFHPADDPVSADDAFTPAGPRHWTMHRYRSKLNRLAQVIIAAGGWEPPAIVGLCEIENGVVLEDLVSHPLLLPYQYSYLHREGPDHRGMDVACLFRSGLFNVSGWEWFAPPPAPGLDSTREMLHLWGSWGKDSLDVFLVHFISRYRGAAATAAYRLQLSARLVSLADSVRCLRHGQLLVMAGDFNDPWEGLSQEPFRKGLPSGDTLFRAGPCGESYKYRGRWSNLDRFVISGVRPGIRMACRILKLPALLTRDEKFGGEKPFRTYEGYVYKGGFSDHLPVVLEFSHSALSTNLSH